MNKRKIVVFIAIASMLLATASCINPFAPAMSESDVLTSSLGNQKTIDGFFQNFLYAYNMKDTVVYSNLLSDDFVFSYRNYEEGIDRSFSKPEDVLTTYRLFNAAQNLRFVWNEILSESGSDTNRTITRSFNLTITFSATDVATVYGKVFFIVKRNSVEDDWLLSFWQDESSY
jgi:hypothetical protein